MDATQDAAILCPIFRVIGYQSQKLIIRSPILITYSIDESFKEFSSFVEIQKSIQEYGRLIGSLFQLIPFLTINIFQVPIFPVIGSSYFL
jgi:hypothetical protein